MTDTETAPDHVDLSAEEDGADTGADYWSGSSAILETPAPEMPVDGAAAAAPAPPPAEKRRERPKLFVALGHIFSGGPNGS